jgi:hypothetical protein
MGERTMKRLSFFSACILLAAADAASAAVIGVTADRSSYDDTWDRVVLTIASIEGAELPVNYRLCTMLGTWTANNGAFSLPGDATTWYGPANVRNNEDAQDNPAPQTWINLSNKSPDVATRTAAVPGPGYSSFYIGLGISPAAGQPNSLGPVDLTPGADPNPTWDPAEEVWVEHPGYSFDNTLLAIMYVDKSTTFYAGETVFSGQGAFCRPEGAGAIAGVPIEVRVSPGAINTPEPSTLALLGCGLLGLLGYALRKRK